MEGGDSSFLVGAEGGEGSAAGYLGRGLGKVGQEVERRPYPILDCRHLSVSQVPHSHYHIYL